MTLKNMPLNRKISNLKLFNLALQNVAKLIKSTQTTNNSRKQITALHFQLIDSAR